MTSSLMISFFLPLSGAAVGVAAGSIVAVYVIKEKIANITDRLVKIENSHVSQDSCGNCKEYQLARHQEVVRRLEAVEVGIKEAASTVKDCFEELVKALQPGGCK